MNLKVMSTQSFLRFKEWLWKISYIKHLVMLQVDFLEHRICGYFRK